MQLAIMDRFVEDVRVVEAVAGVPVEVERLPDGRTAIVVRATAEGGGDAWVMGPRTRALFKTVTGVARSVIVELRPGWAAAVLGVGADTLTDRHVLLEDLWGARISDELLQLDEPAAVVARVMRLVAERAPRDDAGARLARRAVQLLEAEHERADRLEEVARRLGVTGRHLRRVFREHVGVGPKEFARSVRLRRAVRRSAGGDWGRVAVDAGYYDQAHLIGEFRELVGVTPAAYARRAIARKDCR